MPEVPEVTDKREWTCPECDYALDVDMEPQPGDIIECSCGAALLVEDDLSLTPGELDPSDGETFIADDEPELVIDQEDEEDDPDEEDEEEEPEP